MLSSALEENRKQIIETQKSLINAILAYQIEYDSGSVVWSVNVQFVNEPQKKV
jgi:hypothetical protein